MSQKIIMKNLSESKNKYDLDTRILKMQSKLNTKMLVWWLTHTYAEWFEMLYVNPHYIEWARSTFNEKKKIRK